MSEWTHTWSLALGAPLPSPLLLKLNGEGVGRLLVVGAPLPLSQHRRPVILEHGQVDAAGCAQVELQHLRRGGGAATFAAAVTGSPGAEAQQGSANVDLQPTQAGLPELG